jgi:hypothetical protein
MFSQLTREPKANIFFLGTRHEAASRLAARGAYAIVNTDTEVMSKRETHLGYHISHPKSSEMGNVQSSLGIYSASSFVLQVKNPHAPTTGPRQVRTKGADYPAWIMRDVFGAAAGQGQNERREREASGLRFASCETPELLEYEGAQLLLIAAREGEQGLDDSLAEGRGVGKILHLATFSFRSYFASPYRAGGGGKSQNSQADLARAFRRRGSVSLRALKGRMDLNK